MTIPAPTRNLTQITERLSDILEQENGILIARKPRDLNLTQPEKERLTGMYESAMADLKDRPELLSRLDPDDMSRLRQATGRFQDALAEHRRLVQTAKSVTERMVRAITTEIAKRDRPRIGYDRSGAYPAATAASASRPVTLTLNQTV